MDRRQFFGGVGGLGAAALLPQSDNCKIVTKSLPCPRGLNLKQLNLEVGFYRAEGWIFGPRIICPILDTITNRDIDNYKALLESGHTLYHIIHKDEKTNKSIAHSLFSIDNDDSYNRRHFAYVNKVSKNNKKDLYISPEAVKDIQTWNYELAKEQLQRIYLNKRS